MAAQLGAMLGMSGEELSSASAITNAEAREAFIATLRCFESSLLSREVTQSYEKYFQRWVARAPEWAPAWRKDTHVSTNNWLEAFHSQLKLRLLTKNRSVAE